MKEKLGMKEKGVIWDLVVWLKDYRFIHVRNGELSVLNVVNNQGFMGHVFVFLFLFFTVYVRIFICPP